MQRTKRTRVRIRNDISAEQLQQQALSCPQSQSVKLTALARIAEGEKVKVVAEACSVSVTSVYNWIHGLNVRGIDGFTRNVGVGRPPILHLRLDLTPKCLQEMSLEQNDPGVSKRLLAISKLIGKELPSHVARDLGVSTATISAWIKRANKDGLNGLIHRKVRPARVCHNMRTDIPAKDLRCSARSALRKNKLRAARRLDAVAYVLDGLKLVDVAQRVDVSLSTVGKWCFTFNTQGIEGLLGRHY